VGVVNLSMMLAGSQGEEGEEQQREAAETYHLLHQVHFYLIHSFTLHAIISN
jgi:hypothetical protein